MIRIASVLVGILFFFASSFSFPSIAMAALVIDDAVFAHDFEVLSGDTVISLRGPNATKTSSITGNLNGIVGFGSTRHLRAPIGSDYATIDTGTRLSLSTSQLSFSIFYNDRGDNGNDDDSYQQVRLLSSYNGTGWPPNESIFGLISSPDRRLFFSHAPSSHESTATLPTLDALWHQAGFVFDGGLLTFYFDGAPLGSTINTGYSSLAIQSSNWFLVEDTTFVSNPSEYFDGGDYDEAALWHRALSSSEMNALYTNGLGAAVASIGIWRGPGGGSYNLASNWMNDIIPNGINATADLYETITASSTVTLDSDATVGTINFDSAKSYTLAGTASMKLQVSSGSASINVLSGSHEISAPVILNSDTQILGSGMLSLSGGVSGNHTLSVLGNITATSIQVDKLSIGSVGATLAVPEPGSLAMLFTLAVGGLLWWRKRKRS